MPPRRKILVVAGNLSHLDQFVIHGFFKELSEEAEVYLTLPEQELETDRWRELKEILGDVFMDVSGYRYLDSARKAGYQIGAASMFRNRNKSVGYKTRFRIKFFIDLNVPIHWVSLSGFGAIFNHRKVIALRLVKEIPSVIRGIRICFPFWSRIAEQRVNRNCSLANIIGQLRPDTTVILMQRQAGFVISAIAGCGYFQIPSVLIPVKWDNATSKSPLIRVPTRMLVFSNQIKGVCSHLHGMNPETIIAVGNVEVDIRNGLVSQSRTQNIALIGSSAGLNLSVPWLTCVTKTISNCESLDLSSTKVIWRPYPTAEEANFEFMRKFLESNNFLELDQDILNNRSHRASGRTFAEVRAAYERYCQLLQDSILVVSECTSAILDARARGVPVIVPALRRDAVIGSQWHMLNGFEHLQGLVTTGGVFIAEDEVELERLLTDFLTNPRRIPPDNTGENIFVDHRSYARRVLDVVEDVLSGR